MPILTIDELLAKPPSAVPSLIGYGLLPVQGKLLIVGETEMGKSVVAFDIAISLALQKPLFAACRSDDQSPVFPVHVPASVLYFDAELGRQGCYDRFKLFWDSHGIHSIGGLKEGIKLVTEEHGLRLHRVAGDRDDPFDKIRDIIQAHKPDVIIIDPLIDFHQVDENTSALQAVLSRISQLQDEFGCAAIVTHHASGKDIYTAMGKKIEKDDIDRPRGHSSLVGWADTILVIQREPIEEPRSFITMKWAKSRRGRRPTNGVCFADLDRMKLRWVLRLPRRGRGGAHEVAARQKFLDDYNRRFPVENVP